MRWPEFRSRLAHSRSGGNPALTVLWLDDGVTLARWNCCDGEDFRLLETGHLAASVCSVESFTNEVARLCGDTVQRPDCIWLVARECLPGLPASDGELPPHLPEWMEACWRSCPASVLPGLILSALAVMETILSGWEPLQRPGMGILLPLGTRTVFLAGLGANPFRRISRKPVPDPDNPMDADWIRQTRMLFRHRSGRDLEQFFFPTASGRMIACSRLGVQTTVLEDPPAGWLGAADPQLSPVHTFAHACALVRKPQPGCHLRVPLLERRRRLRQVESHLKVGVVVLLAGWMLFFMSACRLFAQAGPTEAERLALWQEDAKWREMDRQWQANQQWQAGVDLPYRVIGTVLADLPEPIRLSRLRLSRIQGDPNREDLQLHLEGTFSGSADSPVFRTWLDRLQGGQQVRELTQLRLDPRPGGMAFSLQGPVGRPGYTRPSLEGAP